MSNDPILNALKLLASDMPREDREFVAQDLFGEINAMRDELAIHKELLTEIYYTTKQYESMRDYELKKILGKESKDKYSLPGLEPESLEEARSRVIEKKIKKMTETLDKSDET